MPVKVRCPECDKALQAPDVARGKAIKCPQCAARVSVPAGDADDDEAPARPKKSAAKAPPPKKKPAQSTEDFLMKADLGRSEDHETKVCPKCGAELDEEDIECGSCGIDLRTGTLGKTARKARMKGPDPADYYKIIWADAWLFLKANFDLTLLSFTSLLTNLLAVWVCGIFAWLGATNEHPASFWFFIVMEVLFLLGIGGWFLYICPKVTSFAIEKKNKLDRTPFELFTGIATGVSWSIWCVAALLPAAVILGPIYLAMQGSDPPVLAGVLGGIGVIWLLPLVPLAMAHRAMPVQWKLWVSPLLWKAALINIGPIIYTGLVILVAYLPAILVTAGGVALGTMFAIPTFQQFGLKYDTWTQEAWMTFAIGHFLPTGALSSSQSVTQVTVWVILVCYILVKVLALFLFVCGSMAAIRVLAQFTYFHKKYLDLITEAKEVKYVAKKIEYGPDGEPIKTKMSPGMQAVAYIGGLILFYGTINIVLYFTTGGKYIFLPRPLAKLLNLVNDGGE